MDPRPHPGRHLFAAVLACTVGCFRVASPFAAEEPSRGAGVLEGWVSKTPGRHPIDRYNRMGYFAFDLDTGGQVLVYTSVFIPCGGKSRVEGGWVTVTDEIPAEKGPPVTE